MWYLKRKIIIMSTYYFDFLVKTAQELQVGWVTIETSTVSRFFLGE
jgi:hypothetical protein